MVRYADVLLMAAEAHFQTGNVGVASGFVNEIRTRAGMPSITVSTLQDIWTERRLELACEGHRFFDLVRTNQAVIHIDGFQVNKNELFPIPQIEIDLAGGNWTQNTGY